MVSWISISVFYLSIDWQAFWNNSNYFALVNLSWCPACPMRTTWKVCWRWATAVARVAWTPPNRRPPHRRRPTRSARPPFTRLQHTKPGPRNPPRSSWWTRRVALLRVSPPPPRPRRSTLTSWCAMSCHVTRRWCATVAKRTCTTWVCLCFVLRL